MSDIKQATENWVNSVVVDLNLCPFAKREIVKNRVRYCVSEATDWNGLTADLETELTLMQVDESVETTLLIHPQVLTDFYEYSQYLNFADSLVSKLHLEGIIQIASFHPQYEFVGTDSVDVTNSTNQSPYPMLHLLREASLETAIANYPNADLIPDTNMQKVQALGSAKMSALLKACFNNTAGSR